MFTCGEVIMLTQRDPGNTMLMVWVPRIVPVHL